MKAVSDQLVSLMGNQRADLVDVEESGSPQIILMAGLQGVGKTTACGKMALYLKKQETKVVMIAADVYRPAAIDQLVKLGSQIDVDVFTMSSQEDPVHIVSEGVKYAQEQGAESIIVDTAGRLQVNVYLILLLAGLIQSVWSTPVIGTLQMPCKCFFASVPFTFAIYTIILLKRKIMLSLL